jgi:glutathione synthase/RimK-type ligase-like ATP-grasp enzyme
MARIRIYPYKMGSRSATALRDELRSRGHDVLKVRPDGRYSPRRGDLIINWGNSTIPEWMPPVMSAKLLQHFSSVKSAANKLLSFQALAEGDVPIPEFTTNEEKANEWLREGDGTVVARTVLTGHSGRGVHINTIDTGLTQAPLYVKYIKKMHEFRVHVFNGQVIDIQQKKRRNGLEDEEVNYKVRNLEGGWVFCREGVEAPSPVLDCAIRAVDALNLHFGAVDVIWNEHYERAYVLEINTAPGLEGSTVHSYADKIEEICHAGS